MLRNSPERFGLVAVTLHWAIAVLFLGEVALGALTQIAGVPAGLQFSLYQWHKSFGFMTLALALLRLGVSVSSTHPRPHASLKAWERAAARLAHGVLLALTIVVPITGWAVASASPLRIPSYPFNLFVVPMLPIEPSLAREVFFSSTHAVLAYGALVLSLGHATAAVLHARRHRLSLLALLPG